MAEVHIIGVDIAKRVFQLHGAGAAGEVVFRKTLRREAVLSFLAGQPRCTVAMEACSGASYWGREIGKLGHEVRLIAPQYVKPFVKRQKNDAADAEAIVEAAVRPTMRFVAVKTIEQQSYAVLFRHRDLLVRQRTQLINALRGHLAEFGIVVAQGTAQVKRLADRLEACPVPILVKRLGLGMLDHIALLDERIAELDAALRHAAEEDTTSTRLQTMPGVGPVTALALRAFAPAMKSFETGRHFAAWLGLVPRQASSGGKTRLGRTSREGQHDIRRLLIGGAMAVLAAISRGRAPRDPWLVAMLARKPRMVVAVALANRMARGLWAMATKGESYRYPAVAA